jgi:hypothetical protein
MTATTSHHLGRNHGNTTISQSPRERSILIAMETVTVTEVETEVETKTGTEKVIVQVLEVGV